MTVRSMGCPMSLLTIFTAVLYRTQCTFLKINTVLATTATFTLILHWFSGALWLNNWTTSSCDKIPVRIKWIDYSSGKLAGQLFDLLIEILILIM